MKTTYYELESVLSRRVFFHNDKLCFAFDYNIESSRSKSLIMIHGFGDYHHNEWLYKKLIDDGYNILAITLRNYGVAINSKHNPDKEKKVCYIDSIDDYALEIDTAFGFYFDLNIRNIMLYGFSTGGLTATHYAHHGKFRNNIETLILCSPFFDFNSSCYVEAIFDTSIPTLLSKYSVHFELETKPKAKILNKSYYEQPEFFKYKIKTGEKETKLCCFPYTTETTEEIDVASTYGLVNPRTDVGVDGEVEIMYAGFNPIYVGWIVAVTEAQKPIQKRFRKFNLNMPTIVLTTNTDHILSNKEIIKYSKNISTHSTTLINIPNGFHDVFCSKLDVRIKFYDALMSILSK